MGNLSTNEYFMTWDRGIDGYCWWLEYLGELKSTKYTVQICIIVIWWYWSTNLKGLSFDQMGFNQVGVNQQCMSMVTAPAFFQSTVTYFHGEDYTAMIFEVPRWTMVHSLDMDDGKTCRKPLYLMVKKHGFRWRCSQQNQSIGTIFGDQVTKHVKVQQYSWFDLIW